MRNNSLFVLSFNASPYFQLKKIFHIYFFIVFLNNARKSCAPFMKNIFPHDKVLQGKFLLTYLPLLKPPPPLPNLKIPLKTPVHFQITICNDQITICKHWSKFVTCGPSHGVFWGESRP